MPSAHSRESIRADSKRLRGYTRGLRSARSRSGVAKTRWPSGNSANGHLARWLFGCAFVPLRFILFGQKGISIAGNFAHRRSLNARLHCFRRKDLIDSAAHDLVAFACRFFEPRSVNLDQTPSIRSDSTRHPELAHDLRHSRSSYSKQLRKRLLRQRQDVTINSIVDVE